MDYFVLSNGVKIPAVDSGTNPFSNIDGVYTGSTKEVFNALEAGYRFFDTAESYGNEVAIGQGIVESGIPRKEIFIATKLKTKSRDGLPVSHTAQAVSRAIERSLEVL